MLVYMLNLRADHKMNPALLSFAFGSAGKHAIYYLTEITF